MGLAAPRRSSPDGQLRYSDLTIELVLTLRLVFHLAPRQAKAFSRSVLRLLGLSVMVVSRRWWNRVVESGGGIGWWNRVVESGGGIGWWNRVVESGGGVVFGLFNEP